MSPPPAQGTAVPAATTAPSATLAPGATFTPVPSVAPCPILAASLETRYVAEIARQAYLDTYAESLDLWQRGDHAVIFPFGTWNVVRHHAGVVAVPPPNFRR